MKRKRFFKFRVGMTVDVEAQYGPCSGGPEKITKLTRDKVYFRNHVFSRKTGLPLTEPWAYCIMTEYGRQNGIQMTNIRPRK